MKVAVVSVTPRGTELGLKVAEFLNVSGCGSAAVYSTPCLAGRFDDVIPLKKTLREEAAELLKKNNGLVMIMALGIVVRILAPHIRDKRTDPAVVVMDEGGGFVISVISGHLGGANDLARLIGKGLGATPVITTATDVNGVPAVDVLARDLKLVPDPPSAVKIINAALARGERVDLYTSCPLPVEDSPCLAVRGWDELEGKSSSLWRVLVTGRLVEAGETDLLLRPRNLVAGVGCKRGAGKAEILEEIKNAVLEAGYSPLSLRTLATIRAKISEEGLAGAAAELGVPLLGFEAAELNQAIEQYGLSKSDFVMRNMGVGGVCEPASMLACRKGRLVSPKRKKRGITVALAEESSAWWD